MKKFIDIHVPVTSCNFKCKYCYVTQMGKNGTEKMEFKYDVDTFKRAFSRERLGGDCLINICGLGETLIPEKLIDYVRALLEEGHYVMIVTNGSLKNRFIEYSLLEEELRERLFFKFSYHYLELKRLNLIDTFFENVNIIKKANCSFTIEITPYDELEKYYDELREVCYRNTGAYPHVTIPRAEDEQNIPLLSTHSIDDFAKIWEKDSDLFRFKKSIWGVKRKEFCHAGQWSGLVDLGTGFFTPCYCIRAQKRNFFENLDKKFVFYPVGKKCKMPHCYNGHSFLTLGNIPEIDTYHFDEVRNRKCVDGTYWLNEKTQKFYNGRLNDGIKDKNTLFDKISFKYIKDKTILKNVIKKIFRKK